MSSSPAAVGRRDPGGAFGREGQVHGQGSPILPFWAY